MGPREPPPRPGACSTASTASSTSPVPASATSAGPRRTSTRSSRPAPTRRTPSPSAVAAADHPVRLVSGSAVGFYGDRGDEELTEASPTGRRLLPRRRPRVGGRRPAPAVDAGASVAFVAVGHRAGAPRAGRWLRSCGSPGFGLGGPIGWTGRQFWPWITLADEVGAILHLLDRPDVTGPGQPREPAAGPPARDRRRHRRRPAPADAPAGTAARPAHLPRRVRRRDPRRPAHRRRRAGATAATPSSTPTSRPRPAGSSPERGPWMPTGRRLPAPEALRDARRATVLGTARM